jgi:methylglutaconyl-CoA hydratase
MTATTLTFRRQGPVAWVVMDRAAQRNAFNPAMIAELTEAFRGLAREADGARAAVLAGDGDIFSAGADVAWMRAMGALGVEENVADAHRLADLFQAIRDCPLPVIARVQGAAMGGGSGLVAACDLAVAAKGTRFAFSEARLGIVPAVISPFVLSKVAPGPGRELFLTGETFDADRAREIGLVSRVADAAALDEAVEERLEALLAAGPQAQAAIKQLVPRVLAANDPAAMRDFTTRLIAERRASGEGREGLTAFLERRKPMWMAG